MPVGVSKRHRTAPRGDGNGTMRQNGTRQVFNYWNTLRGERAAPRRSDIAPAALGGTLAHLFILEADGAAVRFRLAGTWLGTVFGRELTGTRFAALFGGDDLALADRLVDTVAREAAVNVLDLHATAEGERSADLEMVLLPLDEEPARILGAVHARGNPFWFGAYPLGAAHMRGVRLLDPARPLFSLANRPTTPFHRPGGPGTGTGTRRALRVIEGSVGDRRPARAGTRPPPGLRLVKDERGTREQA